MWNFKETLSNRNLVKQIVFKTLQNLTSNKCIVQIRLPASRKMQAISTTDFPIDFILINQPAEVFVKD